MEDAPEYSVTYYYLGLLYLKENKMGKAKKAFSWAREIYPKDPRYQEYLARL